MNYRPNNLNMVAVTAENCSRFPAYPPPWFLILDDSGVILGDGQTPDEAEIDFALGRDPNTPSPQATKKLSFLQRQARRQRRSKNQANREKQNPVSDLMAALMARDTESKSKSAVAVNREVKTVTKDPRDAQVEAMQNKIIENARNKIIDNARQRIIDNAVNSLDKRKNDPETESLSSTNPS